MQDRGMIKWQPFNSVINSKYLINDILKEKERKTKPTLSDEQIETIEKQIFESMINKIPIELTIYNGGYFKNIKTYIKKIDLNNKLIYLNDNKHIYFFEILKAKLQF